MENGITICFWTKPIGFNGNNQLILTVGDTNALQMKYSSEDEPIYGLYILGNSGSDDEEKIISYESEFRDNIAKNDEI